MYKYLLYICTLYMMYAYSHHIMEGHHSDVHDHTDADDLIGETSLVYVLPQKCHASLGHTQGGRERCHCSWRN